jgi:hypothetical protein
MNEPQSLAPNDGPVMRWAIVHSAAQLVHKAKAGDLAMTLAKYQFSRDRRSPQRSETSYELNIDGMLCGLDFFTTYDTYTISLHVGEASIVEKMTVRKNVLAHLLTIFVKTNIPTTLIESAIGQPADKLISLPPLLQTIIVRRTIIGIDPPRNAATNTAIHLER